MKQKLLLVLVISTLFSCKSQKNIVPSSNAGYIIENPCPPEGNCTIEVIKDKSLLVKTDGSGHIYYQLKDTPGKTVIKYVYKKNTDPGLQDAGYSEEVIFETDEKLSGLSATGNDIQKTKMLFGVHCFCRGKAGFYKIQQGSMNYSNKKLNIELPEVIDSQKTKSVTVTFK